MPFRRGHRVYIFKDFMRPDVAKSVLDSFSAEPKAHGSQVFTEISMFRIIRKVFSFEDHKKFSRAMRT